MTNDGLAKPPRAIPIAIVPLVVVGILLGTAVALRVFHSDRVVPVLARNVPAGQRITKSDLAMRSKIVSGFGLSNVADRANEIRGHVALTSLRAGEPVPVTAVTATTVPADFSSCALLRFRTVAATTVDVRSGESVKLMFAPTGYGVGPGPGAFAGFLIDNATERQTSFYFVAVPRSSVAGLLNRLGRSHLSVGLGVAPRCRRPHCVKPGRTRTRTRLRPKQTSSTRQSCHPHPQRPEGED